MRLFKAGILFIIIGISLIACTSGLDLKYNESSKEEDLIEVAKKISPRELDLIKKYILESKAENEDLNGYNYRSLLIMAEEAERIKEEKKLAWEKEQEEKKIIMKKAEVLCAKSWKIKEYAYQMQLPDTSEEMVEMAKNTFMSLLARAGAEPHFSVKEKSDGAVLMVVYDEVMMKYITDNYKRRKIYSMDGMYKEVIGSKVLVTGTWEFADVNKIKERRPSPGSASVNAEDKGETVILNVEYLDENAFSFSEWQSSTTNLGSTGGCFYVIMESAK